MDTRDCRPHPPPAHPGQSAGTHEAPQGGSQSTSTAAASASPEASAEASARCAPDPDPGPGSLVPLLSPSPFMPRIAVCLTGKEGWLECGLGFGTGLWGVSSKRAGSGLQPMSDAAPSSLGLPLIRLDVSLGVWGLEAFEGHYALRACDRPGDYMSSGEMERLAIFGKISVWSRDSKAQMCQTGQVPSPKSSVWVFNRRAHAVQKLPIGAKVTKKKH